MELNHLKYFQVVAKHEHITRAAEELRISQPALSKTIATLEEELQTQLFDRFSKYIRLNEQGRRFLKHVDTALAALEDGRKELSDMAGNSAGTIHLLIQEGSYLIPDLLSEFRKLYPKIKFQLSQHHPGHPAKSYYDLCIESNPPALLEEHQERTLLFTEEIFLAVPIDHPLAAQPSVNLKQVAGEGFLSLRPGQTLREITDLYCKLSGFQPGIVFESDDPSILRRLIKAGQGVSFMPEISWGSSAGSSVALLRIDSPLAFARSIELRRMKDRYMSEAARLFHDFAVDYFAKLSAR